MFLVVLLGKSQATSVTCEEINVLSLNFIGDHKTCIMTKTTVVDSRDTTISATKDDTLKALNFWSNTKISYLPVEIHKSFPNLIMMDAGHCSLKEITKANFEKLGKLQELLMCCNQIERIDGDTFKDSPLLEYLGLGDYYFI